ncbi:FAD-dependent oxidoreductase [Nocardia sp. NPDC127526]|uniref:FAD-dependent oxidoreductase n=1 Tax=Nocardia sp. NPDC127526 TaxID=3345393 RepID=UPI00362EEBE9
MVTILGGGIAGLGLAGALAHHRHPVTVFERSPAPSATGAFMTLDGAAHRALAGLGVPSEALHTASHACPGFRFHYLPEDRIVPSQGHRLYQRADLMRVLTDFARAAGTDIRYDQLVTGIDPATGALTGRSGELCGPGLVIAADGIDSLARACLEPERDAVHAGQIVLYGTTTRPVALPTEPNLMHFHGRLGSGPIPLTTFGHMWTEGENGTVYWFTRLTRTPIPLGDIGVHPVATWAEAVRSADRSAADLIDAILAATDTVHVSNCRNVEFTSAAAPTAPVILAGDADHAISPAAARGAREALEDALALFTALSTGGSPAEAMAARRVAIAADREQQMRRYTAARASAPSEPTPEVPGSDSRADDFDLDEIDDPVTRMWFI